MRKIFTLFVALLCASVVMKAQPCVGSCSVYAVSSITPNILPSAGTAVTLSDDQVSGACPIGFTFNFYCNNYTNFYISSNGFISFNAAVSNGCCSGASIPSPGNAVNNFVAFDWNDLYPPGGGSIRYQTIGVAPNRICVITYSTIPHCCNNGPAFNTGQIKLFETTNIIEIHNGVITQDGSTATQGIMNQAGTSAVAVAGRNGVVWTGTSEAYQFAPSNGGPTAPVAILGNTSICTGVAQVYSVAPMAGALQYNWSLPPGWSGASTTNTISVTPGATGVLSVTATYTCGTSAPATTLNVTVNPNPTVTISGGTVAVCPGNTVTLTGNGAATYSWNTGAIGQTLNYVATSNTMIVVIGTSAAGCTASAAQGITVTPSPTVTISGNTQICAGQTSFLNANGATSYTWSTGAQGSNISVTPSVTTTYSVLGTSGSCPATAAVIVTVNPNPTVTIAGNNTLCAGNALTLTANGATSYTWSTGGLNQVEVVTPTANITYTAYGSFTTGCSGFAVHSVTVNTAPTLTVTGPNAMCLNQTITLTAYGAVSYSWSTGALTPSVAISPTTMTSYTVTGTSTLSCPSSPYVKIITVNPIPTVGVVSTSSLICKGETATITASGVNTYSWNNGALTSSIVVSPSVTTTYSVLGTNTTTGCYKTETISITVSPCTGIESLDTELSKISVYPNPNSGYFTVEYKDGLNREIEILDMVGRSVMVNRSESDKVDIDISSFSNGIYYVRIQSENAVKVVKVVKQ